MDTLTSVSYEYYTYSKNRSSNVYKSKVIDEKIYPNGNLGEQFLEFTEHTKVTITLNSTDCNATMEVENYNNEDSVIVKNGQNITLSLGEDNENMLVPGYYLITIKDFNNIYRGFYKVKPSSIEWQHLLNIREYLEKIVKGLSYNIYVERVNHGDSYMKNNIFIFELYKYIKENYIKLISAIRVIVDNPIIDICKEYDVKRYSKNPDKKSQRWLCNRGSSYNNVYMPNVYWEKHSRLNYNTPENIVFKEAINKIHIILNEAYDMYFNTKNDLKDKLCTLLCEIEESNNYYHKIKHDFNKSKISKELGGKIKYLNIERKKYENKLKIINKHLNQITEINNTIKYYRNQTWIKNIKDTYSTWKPTMRLFKNKYYLNIYNLYKNMYNNNHNGKYENTFPHKQTSKLFEIYSYVLIKDILEDLGFRWMEGWLKEIDNVLSYNGDLESNEKIILIKENYKIELIYDKEAIRDREAEKSGISQVVYAGSSQSRKPDILLNLYEKEKFKGSFIAEIKCRKKKNIYNENEDTDVMCQIKDYSSLRYYDSVKNTVYSDVIKKIVVIYPKQEGKCKFKDELYDFSFIQVCPTNLDEKPYGYNELKEEICEFLGDTIVNN